jgi:hypothetical protein
MDIDPPMLSGPEDAREDSLNCVTGQERNSTRFFRGNACGSKRFHGFDPE